MDVKSAFLNGVLEEVYIEQPQGYEVKEQEYKVLKLKKMLYGLKQAPRAWNLELTSTSKKEISSSVHISTHPTSKSKKCDILIVYLYVDDLIFTGSNPSMLNEFKKEMTKEFEITDIGFMSYYLGIEVKKEDKGIMITPKGYAKEVIKKFKMDYSNSVGTLMECRIKLSKHEEGNNVDPTLYESLVGSLCYLTCTWLNILYAVGVAN